jgi:hypothetical protein
MSQRATKRFVLMWGPMTSKEIRAFHHLNNPVERTIAIEIAAQLAELNERAGDGGFPVQVVGAAATDLHGLFVAAAALQRRKGK